MDRGDAFSLKVADELKAEKGKKKDRAKPITFDEVAEATGLSKSVLHLYFSGARQIPMAAYIDICAALGVGPKVIFERAEKALEEG